MNQYELLSKVPLNQWHISMIILSCQPVGKEFSHWEHQIARRVFTNPLQVPSESQLLGSMGFNNESEYRLALWENPQAFYCCGCGLELGVAKTIIKKISCDYCDRIWNQYPWLRFSSSYMRVRALLHGYKGTPNLTHTDTTLYLIFYAFFYRMWLGEIDVKQWRAQLKVAAPGEAQEEPLLEVKNNSPQAVTKYIDAKKPKLNLEDILNG